MHGAQRLNYAGIATVARRALVATVVVAPPAQLVAPGFRAPDLTKPGQTKSKVPACLLQGLAIPNKMQIMCRPQI